MRELAERGDVILVGRGGNCFLRDDPRAFHVRLIAPMPVRVRRVMEYRWVREAVAKKLIAESDDQRRSFYESYFGVDWSQSPGVPRHGQQRPAGSWRPWTWFRSPPSVTGAARSSGMYSTLCWEFCTRARRVQTEESPMELTWGIAAVWLGLALVASLLSIRFKMSVALVEILVGIAAGNLALLLDHYHVFGLHWELKPNEWIAFLAGFGSILLTFMAGAEIEPSLAPQILQGRPSPSEWRAL